MCLNAVFPGNLAWDASSKERLQQANRNKSKSAVLHLSSRGRTWLNIDYTFASMENIFNNGTVERLNWTLTNGISKDDRVFSHGNISEEGGSKNFTNLKPNTKYKISTRTFNRYYKKGQAGEPRTYWTDGESN